ncbi:MAG: pilus assembly protein PilP [Porticoccaceae bacterium]|nr:pilus assembly protein PilP [Porticoccaceae bacterium]
MRFFIFLFFLTLIFLSGCDEHNTSLIDAKLTKIALEKDLPINDLPVFYDQTQYAYKSQTKRDPFSDLKVSMSALSIDKTPIEAPDLLRKKEPLEFFDLLSFSIVGSIGNESEQWILVVNEEGDFNYVTIGDRIGRDFGEIIDINHSGLVILEKSSDGAGRWFSYRRVILKDENK